MGKAMRALLALLLVAMPSLAAAAPQLKCEFDGRKTKVTIVNTDGKNAQCNYACHFTIDGGSSSVTGSTGVKAGETKVVDEDTRRWPITGLRESSLKCE
jgi:hypothetical protein